MAVKLRLKRFGRLNHPTYRVCAADTRSPRDGRVIETLGFFLPKAPKHVEQFRLNNERVSYWLSVGAQPSETVASLIKKAGIELPTKKVRKKKKRTNKKTFTPPKGGRKFRNAAKKRRRAAAAAS